MLSPTVLKIIEHLPERFVKYLAEKIFEGYIKKYANIQVNGMENLDQTKRPVIFICNHLSNSDGIVLNHILKKEDLTIVAGVKLTSTPLTNLGMIMARTIPIKPNTADKEAVSRIVRTLKNGGNIFIFPEGTRSRSGSMIEAKRGIVLFQKLTGVPIMPIGITGTEKFLPINDSDMGGEEFNYADITVNIGKPIMPADLPKKEEGEDRHEHERRQTDYIMKKIAELLPENYRGVYK